VPNQQRTAASRITNGLVQEWIEQFLEKNRDYNSDQEEGQVFENADVLGIPGQFAEIWRKIWKLKKGMWDGETLIGEQPREILMDFIGHAFLAIDMIDRKAATPKKAPSAILTPDGAIPFCTVDCNSGHTYVGSCVLRLK
jgi:hypothetical protein